MYGHNPCGRSEEENGLQREVYNPCYSFNM